MENYSPRLCLGITCQAYFCSSYIQLQNYPTELKLEKVFLLTELTTKLVLVEWLRELVRLRRAACDGISGLV
jgi:hypothetical protein